VASTSVRQSAAGEPAQPADPRVDAQGDARHDALAQLEALRGSIDNIDAALIHMLAERFRCTKLVGELKARNAMPAADPQREARQVARLRELARDARLDPDFAEKFLAFVIREVIRHHEAIARGPDSGRDGRDA
jgi:chorismate mutase